jgi:hypothetical protein
MFIRHAREVGFANLGFHDLRAAHSTAPLDRGVPAHVVAERIDDDPASLLWSYAGRTKKADASAAAVIAADRRVCFRLGVAIASSRAFVLRSF